MRCAECVAVLCYAFCSLYQEDGAWHWDEVLDDEEEEYDWNQNSTWPDQLPIPLPQEYGLGATSLTDLDEIDDEMRALYDDQV